MTLDQLLSYKNSVPATVLLMSALVSVSGQRQWKLIRPKQKNLSLTKTQYWNVYHSWDKCSVSGSNCISRLVWSVLPSSKLE